MPNLMKTKFSEFIASVIFFETLKDLLTIFFDKNKLTFSLISLLNFLSIKKVISPFVF